MNHRPVDRFFVRALAAVLLAAVGAQCLAQPTVIRQRLLDINGRTIQEIRFGNEPGSSRTLLRAVILTNGPVAGTTTLLTAVADANVWVNPAAPAPVFTEVIASGTVFSVGGGCRRGNQLDFPFINANQPQVLRFVGGSSTIVPVGVGTELWDSADCAVAEDGTRTFFVFTARTLQRGFFFVDAGGSKDLQAPQVSLGQVKTPFAGGLRPAISSVPGTARKVALLFMQPNGQTRWWQYDPDPINVDFNCLVGTQNPPPTSFTIPRGARVVNRAVVGDFNGDGQMESLQIEPAPPAACAAAPTKSEPAGPVAGSGFNWREPGAALDPNTGLITFFTASNLHFLSSGHVETLPGIASGGGSAAACAADTEEAINQVFAAQAAANAAQLQAIQLSLDTEESERRFMISGFEVSDFLLKVFCGATGAGNEF